MADKYIATIKAIAVKKKDEGEIGFLSQESDTWYNLKADESVLDEWLNGTIEKGNVVEFELVDGFVKNLAFRERAKQQENKKGKWEDEMVTFEDLLTKAHELKADFSIKTEMLAVDLEKKYALFKARVIVSNGEIIDHENAFNVYEGHGDTTQENVKGDHIKPHFIRMAETRAIVRALRWYTNNGCAEEEK